MIESNKTRFKIVSDGIHRRVFYGDQDISNRVCSVDFDKIEPLELARVALNIADVDIEIESSCKNEMMDVRVNGGIHQRPVVASKVIIDADGKEQPLMRRPMLFDGEHAAYNMDGSPPIILRELAGK